jgi:hypothetical protein
MATVVAPQEAVPTFVSKVIRKQLDVESKSLYAPVYKWRRLIQVAGGSSLPLSTATSNSIFNIPGGGVYNLANSYLQFDLNLPAAGANTYNNIWTDQIPINDITLQTQSGQIIANLINCPVYTKTARPLCCSMSEYLSRESVYANTTVADAFGTQNTLLQPARVCQRAAAGDTVDMVGGRIGWNNTADAANIQSVGATVAGSLTLLTNLYLTTGNVSPNQISPQYVVAAIGAGPVNQFVISAVTMTAASGTDADYISPQRFASGGSNAITIMRFKIDLNAFVGTILAMDRNVYFGGQNMQLVINYSGLDKWGFASLLTGVFATSVIFANGSLSNYYLYLAQEMCLENIQAIQAETSKPGGLVVQVPYTICPKLAISAPGLSTMNTPLVTGFGVLKRVLTVAVDYTDRLMSSSNCDNVNQTKYTTVQTFLNNSPLQDWALSCANNEDYNYIYNMIQNTPACISSRCYRINSFWCDNFSDADSGESFNEDDLLDSGHEVVGSENYSIQYNIASLNGLQLYQFCTFGRRLMIANNNIQWV